MSTSGNVSSIPVYGSLEEPAKLLSVKDWGWHLYEVSFWYEEGDEEAGKKPILKRRLITSEAHIECEIDRYPCPQYSNWVSWEIIEANVESRLRFVPGKLGGTDVKGSGWLEEKR